MKRRTSTDSSLELLLDTICNTFGGVLFLAILVCILLRNTGHSSSKESYKPKTTEAEVLELVRRQQELESTLERLHAAAAQEDRAAAQFDKTEAKDLHESLIRLRKERDALDSERRTILADIATKQANAAAIEKEVAALGQELTAWRKKAIEVEASLKSDIASHSVTASLPREHVSARREIGFIIRYGRLYQWLRYDRFGNSQGLNSDEFVLVGEENDRLETRPKPYAGTIIEASDPNQIAARFDHFDPHDSYLALAVWDDSFDAFQKVKAAAISAGFEYRLILMREGHPLADRGGSDTRVQ